MSRDILEEFEAKEFEAGYYTTNGIASKAWYFVMTLSFSRHMFVEVVFDQSIASWILLHRHAFEFFGGTPQVVVIDNLKAAVTKTD